MYNSFELLYVIPMQIKKTLKLPFTPVGYFDDGSTLYLLMSHNGSVQVVAYNPEDLRPQGAFWIDRAIFDLPKVVEDDCLYLITDEGAAAVDSFTGDKLAIFKTGSTVPLKICVTSDTVLILAGIPLALGKALDTQKVCISSHSKLTGDKLAQTHSMEGDFFGPVIFDKSIWLICGTYLYEFDFACQLKTEIKLHSTPGFDPIINEQIVVVASDSGTLEIFERIGGDNIERFLVAKSNSPPIICENSSIVWAAGNSVYGINWQASDSSKIYQGTHPIVSTPWYEKNELYFNDNQGSLHRLHLKTFDCDTLSIEPGKELWKPIKTRCGDICIASHSSFYQIGL